MFYNSSENNSEIQNKGHLFIIGGGKRPNYLMQEFIELASGLNSKIVIIPTASDFPDETISDYIHQFSLLGCKNICAANLTLKNVNDKNFIKIFDDANAVFFSGGNQNKLVHTLSNSLALNKIFDIYNRGGIIGGTSAGSAIMSKIMLTSFNEEDSNYKINIHQKFGENALSNGFGFLDFAIIDQHFNTRDRISRLQNAVNYNPELFGIGIDESTAIIVRPDNSFYVIGESSITIVKPSEEFHPSNISANENLILTSGEDFALNSL